MPISDCRREAYSLCGAYSRKRVNQVFAAWHNKTKYQEIT